MNDLNLPLKKEIDETIKLLSQNKRPDSLFKSVQSAMEETQAKRAELIPNKLAEHFLETKDKASEAERSSRAYMCAAAFAIQSQRDLERGNSAIALKRILQASYFLGRALGSKKNSEATTYEIVVSDKTAQILKEAGAAGGKRKDSKRDPVRQEAARLLAELKPKNGWPSKISSAEAIANILINFIKNHQIEKKVDLKISPSEDSLIPLLVKWMSSQPVIAEAFKRNASPIALAKARK